MLTPGAYSRLLHSLADTKGWTVEEWSYEQLRDIGTLSVHAFLQHSICVLHLRVSITEYIKPHYCACTLVVCT